MHPIHRCATCDLVSRAAACPRCGRVLVDHGPRGLDRRGLVSLLTDLVRVDWGEHGRLLRALVRWTVIGSVVGILAGASSAVFLYGLQVVTDARLASPGLRYLLPVGGLLMGLAYHHLGGRSAGGNNLVLEEVHGLGDAIDGPTAPTGEAGEPAPTGKTGETAPAGEPQERRVPTRLAPLVLIGTWVTHLFGGSAGREGTAIQMSASLADRFGWLIRLRGEDRRLLLIAAISGGFAAVFGVPMAGTVFGLEVRSVGRIRYDALVPALSASLVGHATVGMIGLPHDITPAVTLPETALSLPLVGAIAIAGVAFAATALLFSELTDGLKRLLRVLVPYPPVRPAIGGLAIIGLTAAAGTDDYLGLSLPLIGDALGGAEVVGYAFALKLLFTAVTLAAGFQGGEVTPLFVIGATLGAALAGPLGVDQALLAAVGFVAVFAAATNTPLACTIMGVELFGAGAFPYLLLGCVVAYVLSGHRGIYLAQRIDSGKDPDRDAHLSGEVLRDLDATRPSWLQRRRRSTG